MAVSPGKLVVCGALLVAAMLNGVAGCNSTPKLPQLPAIPKFAPPPDEESKNAGIQYRQTAGEAIAPVVIKDEPAPSEAPSAASARPGGGATLNGHPNGLTRETVNHSIQGAMGAIAACFTNVTHDPMVAVSFEAEPDGHPSLVRVNGAPPDAERCIRSVMQGIRLPAFEGKGVQIDFPLSFHRVAQPAQPGNRAGEQQGPSAPPLFLEP
jgi:hypothetical protein